MMEIEEAMGQKQGVLSSSQGKVEIISGPAPFEGLPEDVISNIISFTSPRDACVSASVSKTFESAVNSDSVWEKFLPLEYSSLIPQSRVFSSKKELFFALCDHFLIEQGKKSFWLDKVTGKRCIMLPPKEIAITWVDSPQYWRWISIPGNRFEKLAELLNVWWFEIVVRMNTRYLSPGTRYSAYIVFKTKYIYPGFGDMPIEIGLRLGGQETVIRFIYFVEPTDRSREIQGSHVVKPERRQDGWMEAELGEFFNEASCDDLEITIREIKHPNWKRGFTVQGIEFRPTKSP